MLRSQTLHDQNILKQDLAPFVGLRVNIVNTVFRDWIDKQWEVDDCKSQPTLCDSVRTVAKALKNIPYQNLSGQTPDLQSVKWMCEVPSSSNVAPEDFHWGHSNSLSGVLERVRALLDQTWVQNVQKVYRVGPHQLVHSCERLGFAEPRNVPVLRFQCCESLLSICHRKTLQHLGKHRDIPDIPRIHAVIAWECLRYIPRTLPTTYLQHLANNKESRCL